MWTVKLDPPTAPPAGGRNERARRPDLGRCVAATGRALRLCGRTLAGQHPGHGRAVPAPYGPAATGSPAGWRSPTGCARLPFCRPARPSGGPVGRCERAGEAASDIGDPRNSGIIQGSTSPPVGSIGRHSAAQFLEHCDMSANGCRIGGRPASRVPPVAAVLRRRGRHFAVTCGCSRWARWMGGRSVLSGYCADRWFAGTADPRRPTFSVARRVSGPDEHVFPPSPLGAGAAACTVGPGGTGTGSVRRRGRVDGAAVGW